MDLKSPEDVERQIREVLEGLTCILTAHDSCAELVAYENGRAIIHCGGPCLRCDNRCIEDAIKEKIPHIEVVIQ